MAKAVVENSMEESMNYSRNSASTQKKISSVVIATILVALIIAGFISSLHRKNIGECSSYVCDVRAISLNTYITISKDNEEIGTISGKIIRLITDPLTMKKGDETVAYASDAYHIVSQDSHAILVGEQVKIEMVGKVKIFGDDYDIYQDSVKVAMAKFNYFNTKGELVDNDGILWADYYSGLFRKDYEVRITPECPLTEEEVMLLFASYYSDRSHDRNN